MSAPQDDKPRILGTVKPGAFVMLHRGLTIFLTPDVEPTFIRNGQIELLPHSIRLELANTLLGLEPHPSGGVR